MSTNRPASTPGPTPPALSAIAYARLSEDREGAEAGVGAQLEVCRAYAEANGLSLVAELFDNDVSASRYSRADRPAYRQVLDLVRSGVAAHVIVRETSRLYRRPRDLEDLIDLVEGQGVMIHAPHGGRVDLSSGAGRAHARILAAIDAQESDRISERVRYKHAALAQAGKPGGGGWRPFGLTADWSEVVDAEAAVVRELAARVMAGETLWALADDLNARGITTTTAGKVRQGKALAGTWGVTPLRRMLSRPYLAGLREHTVSAPGGRRVEGLYPASWPAILDRELWAQVQGRLAVHAAKAPRSRAYLLSGLVWCERCGRRMDGHAGRFGKRAVGAPPLVRRYECHASPGRPGCGQTIVAEPLEALVIETLFAAVNDARRAEATAARASGPDVASLSDRRAAVEAKRSDLADGYAAGRISLDLLAVADARLVAETAGLDAQLRRAAPAGSGGLPADLAPLASVYEKANFAQRRALIDKAVARVRVRPAVKAGRGSKVSDRATVDLKGLGDVGFPGR